MSTPLREEPLLARGRGGGVSRGKFMERLGNYLVGVAIGCVLAGAMLYGWYRAVYLPRQQQSQQGPGTQKP